MSDVEVDDAPMAAAAAADAAAPMDIQKAIQEVLKESLIHDGLARGLRETTKALDKRQAIACILAEDCDEQNYKTLIQALCMEHGIPLIKVDVKEVGRVGRPLQDRQGGHCQEDRQVLMRCHQG